MIKHKIHGKIIVLLLIALLTMNVATVAVSASPTDISGATVTWDAFYSYTGKVLAPSNIVVELGGIELIAGTDYTVTVNGEDNGDGSYSDIINVGTYEYATITITGTGDYSGVVDSVQTVTVLGAIVGIDSATVSDKTYDGKDSATVTSIKLYGMVNGEELKLGVDYSVKATFDDASIGEDRVVFVTINLENTGLASNYIARTWPFYITTASITAIPPTATPTPTPTVTAIVTPTPTAEPTVTPTPTPIEPICIYPTSSPTPIPIEGTAVIPTPTLTPTAMPAVGKGQGSVATPAPRRAEAATGDMTNIFSLGAVMLLAIGIIAITFNCKKPRDN